MHWFTIISHVCFFNIIFFLSVISEYLFGTVKMFQSSTSSMDSGRKFCLVGILKSQGLNS